MRRVLVCALLAAIAPAAQATDLLCAGTGYGSGFTYDSKIVVRLEPTQLKLATKTVNGWADGIMRADPDLYMGFIHTQEGVRYWINLHRYSGEFHLSLTNPDGTPSKAEFVGTCRQTERRF